MSDSDLHNAIALIKKVHKKFLEKKRKNISYLHLANKKKELPYLFKAREFATELYQSKKQDDEEYDFEFLNELTAEIFENIKPIKIEDQKALKENKEDQRSYKSKDVYDMIAGFKEGILNKHRELRGQHRGYHNCWEILSNEYRSMNIDCSFDSGDDSLNYEFKDLKYDGYSIGDICQKIS